MLDKRMVILAVYEMHYNNKGNCDLCGGKKECDKYGGFEGLVSNYEMILDEVEKEGKQ